VVPVQIRNVPIYRDIYFGRSCLRQLTAAQQSFWEFAIRASA
jgi:hypothetical protein